MSGFEGLGVVLGVLPLLIATAEHYDDICRPFSRYKHFNNDVKRFHFSLKTQKQIFLNTSQLLVSRITDHEAASRILNGSVVITDDLDRDLSVALGESSETCLEMVRTIWEILDKIEAEDFWTLKEHEVLEATTIQQRKSISKDDEKGSSMNSWTRGIIKAKFSISSCRLDKWLGSLRTLNDEFRTITSQMHDLAKQRLQPLVLPKTTPTNALRRFKVIRGASRQLYAVLGIACKSHMQHTAHLCLDPEQAMSKLKCSAPVLFNLGLTHLVNSLGPESLVWFEVESTSEDDLSSAVIVSKFPAGLKRTLQLRGEPASSTGSRGQKKLKRLRFANPSPSVYALSTPSASSVSISSSASSASGGSSATSSVFSSDPGNSQTQDQLLDICQNGNLCTTIRESLSDENLMRLAGSRTKCIGLLQHTQECRQLVYAKHSRNRSTSPTPETLSEMLSAMSLNPTTIVLSNYEKVSLARKLATAALQYNSTPWLRPSWRSGDILFFEPAKALANDDRPQLTEPHFRINISSPATPESADTCTPRIQPFAKNQLLFGLATVLLEIAYESTFPSFHGTSPADAEYLEARKMADSPVLRRKMGVVYSQIVQKCLWCDFACGSDLEELALQDRFHKDVIQELEILKAKLDIDSGSTLTA